MVAPSKNLIELSYVSSVTVLILASHLYDLLLKKKKKKKRSGQLRITCEVLNSEDNELTYCINPSE